MKVKNLGNTDSLFNNFLSEVRDSKIQTDRMRFRKNLERLGEIMAYEISKTLEYEEKEISTPLGVAKMSIIKQHPILATILRAGLATHQGFLNYFDHSENAFVTAYRHYYKDGNFDIQIDYTTSPEITDKVLIISDPMLATGASIVLTYNALLNSGKPKHTHIAVAIASAQGINYLKKNIAGTEVTLWVGAIDDELTSKSYIVPGLGDAGDLAYGSKLQE